MRKKRMSKKRQGKICRLVVKGIFNHDVRFTSDKSYAQTINEVCVAASIPLEDGRELVRILTHELLST